MQRNLAADRAAATGISGAPANTRHMWAPLSCVAGPQVLHATKIRWLWPRTSPGRAAYPRRERPRGKRAD
eukprot:4145640-Lingulodinium_polyedra.AAC.1